MKNYPYAKEMHALDGVEIASWWGYASHETEVLTHPVAIAIDTTIYHVEEGLKKLSNSLLNHPYVVNAARILLEDQMDNVAIMRNATRQTIRLFMKEGKQLSRKSELRMTWYTHPMVAIAIGEYIHTDTGRLVYIDLEIDILSECSRRFYNVGNEAYALQGDLIKLAKSKWKYALDSDIERSIVELTHLQVAAGRLS